MRTRIFLLSCQTLQAAPTTNRPTNPQIIHQRIWPLKPRMMRQILQLTSVLHRCTSRSSGASTPPSTSSSTLFFTSGVARRAPAPPATSGRICVFGYHAATTKYRGSIANAAVSMIVPPTKARSFASLTTMPFAVDAPNGDHDFQDLV